MFWKSRSKSSFRCSVRSAVLGSQKSHPSLEVKSVDLGSSFCRITSWYNVNWSAQSVKNCANWVQAEQVVLDLPSQLHSWRWWFSKNKMQLYFACLCQHLVWKITVNGWSNPSPGKVIYCEKNFKFEIAQQILKVFYDYCYENATPIGPHKVNR